MICWNDCFIILQVLLHPQIPDVLAKYQNVLQNLRICSASHFPPFHPLVFLWVLHHSSSRTWGSFSSQVKWTWGKEVNVEVKWKILPWLSIGTPVHNVSAFFGDARISVNTKNFLLTIFWIINIFWPISWPVEECMMILLSKVLQWELRTFPVDSSKY